MIKKIYNSIYSKSPKLVQGNLSKLAFKIDNKPVVKPPAKSYFPNGCKGGFVISADFELAWAWRYSKKNKNPLKYGLKKANQSRQNFPVLLKMFEEYDIPITWATVGHLFLESCKKGDHDWMKKIPNFNDHWDFTKGDWYDFDPYSNLQISPAWYAPDLIEKILASNVEHEIGCHSFSHLHFKNSICPPEVAFDDIKACTEAAKRWGITLKSMVFPGGTNGNYEALAKNGFTNYRQNSRYDLFYPEIGEENLVRLPSSFCLVDYEFNWSKEYYIFRYKKYIDKAIETGTVCHGWFHPSENPWIVNEIFPEVLKYVAKLRDQGLLYIATMDQISELAKPVLIK